MNIKRFLLLMSILLLTVGSVHAEDFSAFEGETFFIDVSDFFNLTNISVETYEVRNNTIPLFSSSASFFGINNLLEGFYTLTLALVDENGTDIDTTGINGTIISDFKDEGFSLQVNNFITNGFIEFTITSDTNTVVRREVNVRPNLECLGIQFDLKDRFLEEKLIVQGNDNFNLLLDVTDLDLTLPLNTVCTFNVVLENEGIGEDLTLTVDAVTFTDAVNEAIKANDEPAGSVSIEGELNNGNDLQGYIYTLVNRKLSKGFNTISFTFKNNGDEEIDADIQFLITDFMVDQRQRVEIPSNSQGRVIFPVYIDENSRTGMYPIRITYRINEDEPKTKYGYIRIE